LYSPSAFLFYFFFAHVAGRLPYVLITFHKSYTCVYSVDKPSAPENLSVSDMTENTVKLRWAEPSDNGGCIIKQYVIEKREASKRAWQREGVATDTEYQVIALTTGTPYLFQVAAENEVGVGPFVELSKAVSPRSQFGEFTLF